MTRVRKAILWSAVFASAAILVAVPLFVWLTAPTTLKGAVEQRLSIHLGLPVTIESLSLAIRPRPTLIGTGLVVRVPSRPELEPFLRIDEFWVAIGPLSILRRHVGTVHVGGMKVFVPPGGFETPMNTGDGTGPIIVDHLEAHDAELTLVQRKPDRAPMVFRIHNLRVDDVGFDRRMPFRVALTNYLPEGEVTASGFVGPWQRGEPAALPLSGDYTFTLARLGDIKGIGGLLTSNGKFSGQLTELVVEGSTDTPDFNLDMGGKPRPLSTTFKAVVDGSDGSVRLEDVQGRLLNTPIRVKGTIENLPGPGRHAVNLTAEVGGGRIEDVLSLAVNAPQPMMTGLVRLTSTIVLPPGKQPVRDRLQLSGRFTLDRGRFTDTGIESKVRELSQRSRGKHEPEMTEPERVFTRMTGRYKLAGGRLTLGGLTFAVPGALVSLDGGYSLATSEIDFAGTLRMDATVSQAVGGFKSIFLRPFDRLFRKDGAGAVVPIQITGTRAEPKTAIRFGKVFSRDKS